MAEEPRRSGRSTKGVNPKNQEDPEPPAPKPKKAPAKASKPKTAPAVETGNEPDDDEDEEEVIRCVCGSEDDDEREFVSCDKCNVWQHNDCMGLPNDPGAVDQYLKERFNSEKYFCEQCKPQNHKELLAAIKRGERPWEEAARSRKQAKSKKGGRASKANGTPEVKPPPANAPPAPPAQAAAPQQTRQEKGKRKLAPEANAEADAQPAKLRKSSGSSTADVAAQQARRKSATVSSPAADAAVSQSPIAPPPEQATTPTAKIADLELEKRKKSAAFLRTKFETAIKDLEKTGSYTIPAGQTVRSLAENEAVAVETALFKNHAGSGPTPNFTDSYGHQMRSIGSNITQNTTLMLRLLTQSLTADQLSKMSSDDMASEELQQQMASMKKEAEKQATLIQDNSNRPLVRRTHKGEEVVEDINSHMANDSVTPVPPPRRRESNLESPIIDTDDVSSEFKNRSATPKDTPLKVDTSQTHQRRASDFDMNNVWSSVKSPRTGHSPQSASHPPRSPIQQPLPKPANDQHAADIDRLLDDDDNGSEEEYSPQEYAPAPQPVWRGWVDMPIQGGSVARFQAESRHVAGTSLENKVQTLASVYPENLEISGRIAKDRADQYLTSLSASKSTDVTVHNLTPASPDYARNEAEFVQLFEYFLNRSRYGVVADALHKPNVSDVYLIPLASGEQTLPSFLERLEYNTIQSPVPRPQLLVVFILKWKPSGAPVAPAAVGTTEATPAMPTPPVTLPGVPPVMIATRSPPQELPFSRPPPHAAPAPPPAAPIPPVPPVPAPAVSNIYYENMTTAVQVLGEAAHCTTVQNIIKASNERLSVDMMQKLRLVFERDPRAKDDFNIFNEELMKSSHP